MYWFPVIDKSTTCLSDHLNWSLVGQRWELMLRHNTQPHFFKTEDWIFFVWLALRTYNVWRNTLSRICGSFGCHFKGSVDKLTPLLPVRTWRQRRGSWRRRFGSRSGGQNSASLTPRHLPGRRRRKVGACSVAFFSFTWKYIYLLINIDLRKKFSLIYKVVQI